MSANLLYDVPSGRTILLFGPPGVGKSTFCRQVVLHNLSLDRPVIYFTAEYDSSDAEMLLRKHGLGELKPGLLNFVSAYGETVAISVPDRPDTAYADCNDLSSIDIAISRLSERIGEEDILVVFDSLTTPYLFNGSGILRFLRQTLSRFSTGENAIVACIDEGCGKHEDLVAMMSQFNGIMQIEAEQGQKIINVIKHPQVEPAKMPISGNVDATPIPYETDSVTLIKFAEADGRVGRSLMGRWNFRKKMGDWVNILWYQLVFWGGLQWDPLRFPPLLYTMAKERAQGILKYFFRGLPWYLRPFVRLLNRSYIPKRSSVKTLKRVWRYWRWAWTVEGHYAVEYLDEISRDDEHHFRKSEGAGTWGFPNVGAALCFHEAGEIAGLFNYFDSRGWDWDGVEYICISRGDPYCQLKITSRKSPELQEFLRGFDAAKIEKINEHIMGRILSLVHHGEALPKRPTLRDEIHLHEIQGDTSRQAAFSEKYQVILRMAGANSGRKIAELLGHNGVKEAEATKGLIDLFQLTKAGELAVGDTITIEENWESSGLRLGQPFCFFTTGILNGFFWTVKHQHVKETKCVAAGDPVCEWEFR